MQPIIRTCFIVILSTTISISSHAQKKKLWGFVLDSATKAPIENASVTNMNRAKTSMTNSVGRFNIEVDLGEMLAINSINHFLDTVTLVNKYYQQDTVIFYVKSIAKNLQEVTVTALINRYSFDSTERRKSFLKDVGSVKIPVVSAANSGAGIGINIDRFSKRERNKRRAFSMFDQMEEEAYINYRFTVPLVSKYTTLIGDDLQNFMQQHRPSYAWLRKHVTEEDMKYYINEQLKKFNKKKN